MRMKNYALTLFSAVIFGTTLSSCITLFGAKRSVFITSTPSGASVYRDDGEYVGSTPCVYKGKGYHAFCIKKDGYESRYLYPSRKFNTMYLGNLVFTGTLGLLIDIPNIHTFKEKESKYTVALKAEPGSVYTPVTTYHQDILSSISNDTEYKCQSVFSMVKPTYSRINQRTVLRGDEIFEKYCHAVFVVFGEKYGNLSQGSGFFINSEGLAVSNYHNFEKATKIVVKFYGSESLFEITKNDILAYSKNEDYIIFKVKGRYNTPYIPIANQRGKVGARIYTIGTPKGEENTLSDGMISQYRQNYIQISAPIDHGSSGGALINEYGEAIGITSAGRDDSGANLNFCRDLLYILNRFR